MKTWLMGIASALLLIGCTSTNQDTSGMGSATGTTSGAATETYISNPTGIGASATGQPYGAYPSNRAGMGGTSSGVGDSSSSGSGTR